MTTRERGIAALREALMERCAELVHTSQGQRPEVAVLANGSTLARGRVSARASGTWQSNTSYGDAYAPEEPRRIWIFVDLIPSEPAFYVAPEWFVKRDIARAHDEYLARNGGERAKTRDSLHHQISLPRIIQWRDRWDVAGL